MASFALVPRVLCTVGSSRRPPPWPSRWVGARQGRARARECGARLPCGKRLTSAPRAAPNSPGDGVRRAPSGCRRVTQHWCFASADQGHFPSVLSLCCVLNYMQSPVHVQCTSTVRLHGCGIVFLVLFGICVSLRAWRFLSARSGRLPSSSCSTSSLQQPAIRQPGYGSFVRPVFKLRLWSAAIRGTSEHGDGGGYYMGARTAALCLLLGSVAVLTDLIPLQLFHGCERRGSAQHEARHRCRRERGRRRGGSC